MSSSRLPDITASMRAKCSAQVKLDRLAAEHAGAIGAADSRVALVYPALSADSVVQRLMSSDPSRFTQNACGRCK